jgi:hypothetical protein
MSIEAGNLLSRSLVVVTGCLILAAVGCSEQPRIVEPEDPDGFGAAGGAAPGKPGTPASGKPDTTAMGAGGSGAKVGATSAGGRGGDAEDDDADTADDGVNYGWVKFENAPFGQGKTPNAMLRRPLTVTLNGDEAMVGKGYVMRSSLKTAFVDVAIAITNSDAVMRCFIKAEDVVWKTESGKVIPGDSHEITYLSGSVADSEGTPTTTCLGPGEKGYFLESQATQQGMDSIFETLAEVELTLSSSESEFDRPQYRVLPIKWSGSASQLTVTFENMGLQSAPVDLGEAQFIMTDADGLPLTWGFLDLDRRVTILPASSQIQLKSAVYFDGKVSNMLVSFGY